MVQGDRYSLPIKIAVKEGNGTSGIKDTDVVLVRIKIGLYEDSYPDGTVTYDGETQRWLFPLSQEQTFSMTRSVMMQVRVMFENGNIYNSVPQQINVSGAIIKKVESND